MIELDLLLADELAEGFRGRLAEDTLLLDPSRCRVKSKDTSKCLRAT